MKFSFSKHALEQIANRNIEHTDVINVIETPDDILELENNQLVYQKLFISSLGIKYMVRAFINGNQNPALVKTVYLTTKLNKYIK
jgi:hypothetical protein